MRPETLGAIEQARINIRAHPDLKFYYPATLHLNPVPGEVMEQQLNVSFPLAAVDKNGNLGLHEDEFLALDELEQTGLILHEAMHCAHNHVIRQEYLNPKWANIAGDVLINGVIEDGFIPIPDGGVNVASIKTHLGIDIPDPPWDHSMEEIYSMFPVYDDPPDELGNQGGMVPGALPSPESSKTPEPDQEESEQEQDQPGETPPLIWPEFCS